MTMQEQQVQEDRDPTAGQGQPRSEGSSVAPAGAPAASTSTAAPESTPSSPPQPQAQALPADDAEPGVPTDDPEPDPKRTEMAKSVALAELMKPVAAATEDLYSTEPDKVKARAAIAEAYTKAYTELKAKYDAADTSFVRTAEDMAAKLDDWIDRLLEKPDGLVASALGTRTQVQSRLTASMRKREQERARAQAKTKQWADRFADWSSPSARIAALILDPAKIDKLNADINNDLNADAAILTFWFEYAPKHLQLRRDALNNDDLQAQIDRLKAAVGSDLAKQLDPGGQRQDGSVYLLDPDEDDLETHRDDVLESWKNAADQQADAEAAYKLRPDDAATLKQRWDKLKDDGWLKDVKSALEKPAA